MSSVVKLLRRVGQRGRRALLVFVTFGSICVWLVVWPTSEPNKASKHLPQASKQSPLPLETSAVSMQQLPVPDEFDLHLKQPSPAQLLPVDISVRPERLALAPKVDERFLAYTPHSGYHNQRISLENALVLAHALGRTLLLPPVWLGPPIPYVSFDKMQRRLQMATKDDLVARCKPFSRGSPADPLPLECLGFFEWTKVHWSFLVDIDAAARDVPIRERWDLSDEWLERDLGLRPHKKDVSKDVYHLKEDRIYEYRFFDNDDDQPLDKYMKQVSLSQLARDSANHKLLHLGTVFGTTRLHLTRQSNINVRKKMRRAMMFKNDLVDSIATEIRDRLGGAGEYYGLHIRVGDGIFQAEAADNVQKIFQQLCVKRMRLEKAVCDEAGRLYKRKASKGDAPRRVIKSPLDSTLDDSLSCRRDAHSAAHLLPFNTPLYLATDSKMAASDINLAVFFAAFPCTFLLSDFGSVSTVNSRPVERLDQLNAIRSADDGVPLAQFLYPQLDAQVAAWGRDFIGTPKSTFSRFAADVLHQVYHGNDIIDRTQ